MKKIVLISIILIALLTTGCGIFDLNGWIIPDDGKFIEVVESLRTPQEISGYMIENFEYKPFDFTALSPYELFLYKKGDCDIFVKFGVFVADYHNYTTYQIQIFDGSFYSHYVGVYDEDIWLSITDCQYYYFGFDDFKEIVEDVCYRRSRDWTKYVVYDYWDDEIETVYNN